ncbi:MAG: amidohydrolase family protein, partial [Bacteroidota bacterium]
MNTKQRILSLLTLSIAVIAVSWAQTTFPYNGIKDQREGWYAITHATLIPGAGATINNATMVIKNGHIVSISAGGAVPTGAIEIDATGKFVYPSFIDMYAEYGLPEASPVGKRPEQQPQMLSNKAGAYAWNEALKPEYRAADHFKPDTKAAANWRAMGFGTVATHQQDGISRGSSAVVTLGDQAVHQQILQEEAAHHLSFRKGVSTQTYPTSLMGIIALLRQTYLDAQWYEQQTEETNFSLAAWNELQELPQIFAVDNWHEGLRAQKIAAEFDQKYIIKGVGDEYQRLDAFKAGTRFIIPLTFPKAQNLSDPYAAQQVSLTDLRHWEMAPSNAANLAKAGISFALTASGHAKAKDFFAALRKAVQQGLNERDALLALTATPAEMLGVADQVGSLEVGKKANFIITSAPVFEKGASVHHNWVQGKAYLIGNQSSGEDITGKYRLLAGDRAFNMMIR